jgi:beta-lactamase regulating signal transducer with metallopeptidase domain
VFPEFVLDVSIKSAVIFLAAAVATLAMRRASAAARHLVWCAATTAVLWIPLFTLTLPAWRVLPGPAEATVQRATADAKLQAADVADLNASAPLRGRRELTPMSRTVLAWSTTDLGAALWVAGAAACLLPALAGRVRLWVLTRRCRPVEDAATLDLLAGAAANLNLHRRIVLLAHKDAVMPMTWGIARANILLPRESLSWSHARCRAVLLHELAHVKRLDCLTHLIAQVARATQWLNPLAWVAVWRMSVERERACDDLVLHAGIRQSVYARELLDVGTRMPRAPRGLAAIAMAKPSRIERRVLDVLDGRRDRSPLTRRSAFIAAALAALVTLPLACAKSRRGGGAATSTQSATTLPPPIPPERLTICQQNIAVLVEAARQFSYENRGRLPEALGSTLNNLDDAIRQRSVAKPDGGVDLVPRTPALAPRPVAQYYLCDTDPTHKTAPDKPTAQWVQENTLYRYLAANATNAIGKYPADTVMIFEALNWKGHGDTINLGLWDGSVRSMDRASAARAIRCGVGGAGRADGLAFGNETTGTPADPHPQFIADPPGHPRPHLRRAGPRPETPGHARRRARVRG